MTARSEDTSVQRLSMPVAGMTCAAWERRVGRVGRSQVLVARIKLSP